ncbi:heterokaryon incompatibility protein-domain-containing protein [Annulohypoxylon truncatum]|uniref:heterokaryon incompatibility protein-domain-containing protein n=1 Tax=Annulohypoxylon truncatum TaxID=327061 RepID=UPI00200848F6|nr:heterokaryon incompatibility protein-domain-containing protein [Annulohypoxylon truncatum]KAI1207344.1 heterokaryon incompatibility protein-domain-containing protein [Annulohypoxylon truncatum]
MRLLHAKDLVINEYQENIPPYAILSHTWGDEEVSFVDFIEGKAPCRKGYQKIMGCCKQALYDGIEYVWIDTCCIDKRSSVELSEAINSMFNWYRDSLVCYAYLQDVSSKDKKDLREDWVNYNYPSSFKHSRWFDRGWTLQELVAPSVLVFYTSDWASIGGRDELRDTIAEITNISTDFFLSGRLSDFSIAQRMSWASHRKTTRIEDQAYCLLGIFGVIMPLVYGEGKRAFVRLQEEIIKESDDQSIFAWCSNGSQDQDPNLVGLAHGGLLAPSPSYFSNSGGIVRCKYDSITRNENAEYERALPYAITNRGIQISLPVIEYQRGQKIFITPLREERQDISSIHTLEPSDTIAILNCQLAGTRSQIVIFLRRMGNEQNYTRELYWPELASLSRKGKKSKAVVKQLFIQAHNLLNTEPLWFRHKREKLVIIEALHYPLSGFCLKKVEPEVEWQTQETGALFVRVPYYATNGVALVFQHPVGEAFLLLIQWGVEFSLRATITRNVRVPEDADLSQADLSTWGNNERIYGHQNSPYGPFSLRLHTRQAAHAYIIRLECQAVLEDIERVPKENGTRLDASGMQSSHENGIAYYETDLD